MVSTVEMIDSNYSLRNFSRDSLDLVTLQIWSIVFVCDISLVIAFKLIDTNLIYLLNQNFCKNFKVWARTASK